MLPLMQWAWIRLPVRSISRMRFFLNCKAIVRKFMPHFPWVSFGHDCHQLKNHYHPSTDDDGPWTTDTVYGRHKIIKYPYRISIYSREIIQQIVPSGEPMTECTIQSCEKKSSSHHCMVSNP